ncbi:hypothetical protein KC878_03820 [Candidatus Saccharibacteria bacterium]|nr:hypothetical protein [Candidatus Saccharibacteria bacterium]MCB9821736.1 hypothetical protein [Candidatus Nomurabacteria bacterium]
MKRLSNGFSIVELFLVVAVLAIAGVGGYYVYKRNQSKPDNQLQTELKTDNQASDSDSTLEFEDGIRLQPSTFGVTAGLPVADVSAIQLDNGSWRIYAFAQEQGIVSAISDDGLNFTAETGARLGDGAGMPRIIRLADNTYRMYFIDQGNVSSATSVDGLTFVKENGFRITAPDGVDATTGISTPIKLSDGKWHTYFSELPRPGEGLKAFNVYSAISDDLISWTVQDGVRIGGTLVPTAEHPDAVVNDKGEVVLYFFVNETRKLMTATSVDGLKFENLKDTGLDCNDPNIATSSSGEYRLYCGDFDEQAGGIVKSAQISTLP